MFHEHRFKLDLNFSTWLQHSLSQLKQLWTPYMLYVWQKLKLKVKILLKIVLSSVHFYSCIIRFFSGVFDPAGIQYERKSPFSGF